MDKSNIKVFLIHGFEGVPNGGWRSDLMAEMSKEDVYACALSMPSPDKPILSEWLEEIERVVKRNPQDDIYLVGHSLGGTAILRFVERFEYSNIKGLISVSAPCHKNKNEQIASFLSDDFDFELIRKHAPKIGVIHGDNDPLVPLSDAERIARETGGELIVIQNGAHLNGSAGFTKLPECVDLLRKFIAHD